MNNVEYEYIVYKTTNLINGKIYIGVHRTKKGIKDSYIGNGITGEWTRKEKGGIHAAVRKYGYKNFKRETLFTYPDTEDGEQAAYNKEAEIVNRDFVKDPNTYNLCTGGKVPSSATEKEVVQYDLEGHFIKRWVSIIEAARAGIAPRQTISHCCVHKSFGNEWQWRYYEGHENDIEPAKIRTKRVFQFDLQGNYLATFKSLHEAEKATGISYKSIGAVCLNKQVQAGGYYWSYKKRFDCDPSKVKLTPVACYSDNGEFIKSFSSVKEACLEYKVSRSCLISCIKGKTKHCAKVRWRYFYGNTVDIEPL